MSESPVLIQFSSSTHNVGFATTLWDNPPTPGMAVSIRYRDISIPVSIVRVPLLERSDRGSLIIGSGSDRIIWRGEVNDDERFSVYHSEWATFRDLLLIYVKGMIDGYAGGHIPRAAMPRLRKAVAHGQW